MKITRFKGISTCERNLQRLWVTQWPIERRNCEQGTDGSSYLEWKDGWSKSNQEPLEGKERLTCIEDKNLNCAGAFYSLSTFAWKEGQIL